MLDFFGYIEGGHSTIGQMRASMHPRCRGTRSHFGLTQSLHLLILTSSKNGGVGEGSEKAKIMLTVLMDSP